MRLDRAMWSFLTIVTAAGLVAAVALCGALEGVLLPHLLSSLKGNRSDSPTVTSLIAVVAFLAWLLCGVGVGARSFARQLLASRRLARQVSEGAIPESGAMRNLYEGAQLEDRVVLVDAAKPFSFVYGLLTPRIAVSRGLLESVSPSELRAVIEHERYHVRHLDPLRLVSTRVLADALFLLPVLDSLRARYAAHCELAADRQAISVCGDLALAGALFKTVHGSNVGGPEVVAAIGGASLLDVRVAQLESRPRARSAPICLDGLASSVVSSLLLTCVYVASVHGLYGPATSHGTTIGWLVSTALLDGLLCAVPFALAGISAYLLIAARAARPLLRTS